MSKIFEALKRSGGDGSTLALAGVVAAPTPPAEPVRRFVPPPEPPRAKEPAPIAAPPAPPPPAPVPACPEGTRELPLKLSVTAPFLPFDDNRSHAGEQYRILRTRILQHPRQPRMLVISSPGPGDGKSTTAINLAGALALKGEGNVLLLEADFRRSTLHSQLGLPRSPGLADILAGHPLEEALVRAAQLPSLYLITAGKMLANPTELLDLARWPWLCSQLRKLFKYIVVDCPPIGAVADYDLVQAVCDGVVVVVRPDHTNRKLCQRVLEMVPKDKLTGIVLNCVTPWFLSKVAYPDHYEYYDSATHQK